MNKRITWLVALACMPFGASAATTINPVNKHAYGANIGWLNAAGDTANGAVIGEYVCSGYIWGANVGWIHLGDGTPADGVRYRNDSASDYGINHDGQGNLRGYAYGANIGWIHFDDLGGARVDLKTGNLSGFIYSANCGWISLSNTSACVQTDILQPGIDSDGDGIADAWELSHTNSLAVFTATSDTDGDGATDLNEHGADTNPLDPNDLLRVTEYSVAFGPGEGTDTITWLSKPTRFYVVQSRSNLNAGAAWLDATSLLAPDAGPQTTAVIPFGPASSERYLRVQALKPLAP